MGNTEDIQESFAGENQNEEQERTASEAGHKNDQEDLQNNCMKRLRSRWHAILIGVLMMLLCVVTSNLFIQTHKQQSLTAELQHMAEELQIKNSYLKQLLNSTHQNSSECGHMTLLIDAMLYNFTLLSAEKTKLSLLLKNIEKNELSLLLENTSQEKRQLEAKNKDLSMSINLALNNFTSLSAEKTELSLLLENTSQEKRQLEVKNNDLSMSLNPALNNFSLLSAEKTELSLLLENESREKTELSLLLESTLQDKTQLEEENRELNMFLNSTMNNFSLLSAEKTELNLLLENTSKEKTDLSLLLENMSQEKRKLEVENKDLSMSLNSALNSFTSLSAEKTQLSLLLKNTLHEQTQVEEEKKELAMFLHSTMENCNHVEAESRQLHLHVNASRRIVSLASAESERWHQLLDIEWQTTMQLEELNKRQHSVLFSSKLSFLWRFCDRNTLQRSHCLPGWVKHTSHCFFLSKDSKKWEKACRESLDMGADMAVVLNAEDRAFLTNMTFQFVQQHPEEAFHSAWIGLQDMAMESDYFWVTGQRIHPDVTYWRSREPNNAMASWDNSQAGQDCVAIIPPTSTEKQGWVNSCDDIICAGERHYLCETTALSVT